MEGRAVTGYAELRRRVLPLEAERIMKTLLTRPWVLNASYDQTSLRLLDSRFDLKLTFSIDLESWNG